MIGEQKKSTPTLTQLRRKHNALKRMVRKQERIAKTARAIIDAEAKLARLLATNAEWRL